MPSPHPQSFQTTQWTRVLAARNDSPNGKEALKVLCEVYYEPVSLFITRFQGNVATETFETAQDLTHAFFAQLLEGRSIVNVDRAKGRFRSYLLGAVKHFLLDHRDRENSQRRGGDRKLHSLDIASTDDSNTSPIQLFDPAGFPSDAYFDRQWAIALIDRAMQSLKQQTVAEKDLRRFELLTRWLVVPGEDTSVIEASTQLNMSESAFRVAIHRFRKEFRRAVESQVASTLDDLSTINEEMVYLLAALSHEQALGYGGDNSNSLT